MVEQVVQSSAFRSTLRSAGTVIGREITRSLFGTARRRRWSQPRRAATSRITGTDPTVVMRMVSRASTVARS